MRSIVKLQRCVSAVGDSVVAYCEMEMESIWRKENWEREKVEDVLLMYPCVMERFGGCVNTGRTPIDLGALLDIVWAVKTLVWYDKCEGGVKGELVWVLCG